MKDLSETTIALAGDHAGFERKQTIDEDAFIVLEANECRRISQAFHKFE